MTAVEPEFVIISIMQNVLILESLEFFFRLLVHMTVITILQTGEQSEMRREGGGSFIYGLPN
jgi:hypothetical protein